MATYNKKNIEDVEVAGKTVLVRCDFNVPMKDGVITSDKRIVEALPTVKYLMDNGAKVILCDLFPMIHYRTKIDRCQVSFLWIFSIFCCKDN